MWRPRPARPHKHALNPATAPPSPLEPQRSPDGGSGLRHCADWKVPGCWPDLVPLRSWPERAPAVRCPGRSTPGQFLGRRPGRHQAKGSIWTCHSTPDRYALGALWVLLSMVLLVLVVVYLIGRV